MAPGNQAANGENKPQPGVFGETGLLDSYLTLEVIAKVRNLPFDKLRVNGLSLKSLTFSVRGELVEPQKNTFAIGSRDKHTIF